MKKFKGILTCALSALFAIPFAACGSNPNVSYEQVDLNKTQVYVFNKGNGTGNVWVENMAKRFEEYYKDKEFPNKTKGVQVIVDSLREYNMQTMSTQHYSVIINEGVDPMAYTTGVMQDLTDMITEWKLPGEDKTIEDKMTAKEKEVLSYTGAYTMLPHTQWITSPTYNRNLFEKNGFYFADDPADLKVSAVLEKTDCKYGIMLNEYSEDIKKSCGPDLLYGTADDGLPASVEEFKQLTDCMVERGVTPFVCYASTYHYADYLLHAMWATLEGANGVNLYISNDGGSYGTTEIVKVENGKVLKNADGTPQTETLAVDGNNNWKMSYMASKYYALDFFEHIFNKTNINSYYEKDGLSSTVSHTDIQNRFIESEVTNGKPVAFLIDGNYWENESREAGNFAHLKQTSASYYENELDYQLFSLPTQYMGKGVAVGEVVDGETTYYEGKSETDVKKQVGISTGRQYMFLNKTALNGDASAIEAAKLFAQFLYTEESLNEFVKDTGLLVEGINFTVTDATKSAVSEFVRNSVELQQDQMDIVVPLSTQNEFPLNSNHYDLTTNGSDDLFSSMIGNTTYTRWPINGFRNGNSLDAFFVGLGYMRGQKWWDGLLR